MRYCRDTSILAGMDDSVLRARLQEMQNDYLDLMAGRKVQSAQYTQGDGSKAVVFTKATIGQLAMAIRQLQAQLGIIDSPRRAIGVRFN